MFTIDLNCDLGEGFGSDQELMPLISSANIACGFHAGDSETMRRTVELALENDVAIGAHPGYKDKENFGRTPMELTASQVQELIAEQFDSLRSICDEQGTRIRHVKPHGALYNQAAKDSELAAAIAESVKSIDPNLILYGLSGSTMIEEAERLGLKTASEVFADRIYQSDGSLTPRTLPSALITDEMESATQVLDMIRYGRVRSVDASMVAIHAETICIHGDGKNPVGFAHLIRERLIAEGITISPPFSN